MNWTQPQDPPHVGKPFRLSVLLDKSKDLKQELKSFMTTQDYWIQDIQSQGIGSETQWTVTITYFRSGELPLPPLSNQETGTIKIMALSALEEVPMDQLEQNPKSSPLPSSLPTPWVGLTTITVIPLVILGALLFFLIKRFSKKGRQEAFLRKNYTYKKVCERLQKEVLNAPGDFRQKAYTCSELLRGYSSFCTRFGFLELTADEIRFRQNQWKHLVPQLFPLSDYLQFLQKLELMKYSGPDQQPTGSDSVFLESKQYLDQWHVLEKR